MELKCFQFDLIVGSEPYNKKKSYQILATNKTVARNYLKRGMEGTLYKIVSCKEI